MHTSRQTTRDTSATLEIALAILAYVGLFALIMSGPLRTFSTWG